MSNLFVEALQLTWSVLVTCTLSLFHFFVPKTPKNVKGKRVLITGAASGLGRLLAIRFARLGCPLVLWDRDRNGLLTTANQIKEETSGNVNVRTDVVDLCNRKEIASTAKNVLWDGHGDIDILINNAGVVGGKKLLETSDEAIETTFAVNSIALCWTTRAFLPGMIAKKEGHLVTIASSAGWIGVPGLADYCASKYAAVGFDESMRVELKKMSQSKTSDIKTTCVCPFYIDTGMFEGVHTRFPSILPILKPDYVVDRIMEAIRADQEVLFLPQLPFWLPLVRGLLPVSAFDEIVAFFGVSSSMDEFKGRNQKKD